MDSLIRKRNVSDGDSGFDSALSSRSSSISLEESPEFGKLFNDEEEEELLNAKLYFPSLKDKFSNILTLDEDIRQDDDMDDMYVIVNLVTGAETMYKPPSRLKFCHTPSYSHTYSSEEYDRGHPIPRSKLFHSRLEYELEKQVANMKRVEVDLIVSKDSPSLGIRVVGVNMIHGVQDKLNIYVKKVVDESLAGKDGRIMINDHIIEVNGISLVGVSQKLAAQTLSNCAISPETGTVHFVLARPHQEAGDDEEDVHNEEEERETDQENKCDQSKAVFAKEENNMSTKPADGPTVISSDTKKNFTNPQNAFLETPGDSFEGRDAVTLSSGRPQDDVRVKQMLAMARFSKQLVILGSLLLITVYASANNIK